MRHIAVALAAFGVVVGVVRVSARGDEASPAVKDELAKFQGTWQLVAAEKDGERTPEERTRPIRVTITGNTHTVRFGDQVVAHDVSFAIDPAKRPRQVTDTINTGESKGKQILGIYRLEGDTLVSCVAPIGSPDRPTTFAAGAGSGHTLRVFRRVREIGDAKKAAIEAELKRFEGSWRFVSMEYAGKLVPEESLRGERLILKEDRFTQKTGGASIAGVFSVDPSVKPKTIDITITGGPAVGVLIQGIYELEGDVYKVCSGLPGKPRPTSFASSAGNGLSVLAREKP